MWVALTLLGFVAGGRVYDKIRKDKDPQGFWYWAMVVLYIIIIGYGALYFMKWLFKGWYVFDLVFNT